MDPSQGPTTGTPTVAVSSFSVRIKFTIFGPDAPLPTNLIAEVISALLDVPLAAVTNIAIKVSSFAERRLNDGGGTGFDVSCDVDMAQSTKPPLSEADAVDNVRALVTVEALKSKLGSTVSSAVTRVSGPLFELVSKSKPGVEKASEKGNDEFPVVAVVGGACAFIAVVVAVALRQRRQGAGKHTYAADEQAGGVEDKRSGNLIVARQPSGLASDARSDQGASTSIEMVNNPLHNMNSAAAGIVSSPSAQHAESIGPKSDGKTTAHDGEWIAATDPTSGKTYYYNSVTSETRWNI